MGSLISSQSGPRRSAAAVLFIAAVQLSGGALFSAGSGGCTAVGGGGNVNDNDSGNDNGSMDGGGPPGAPEFRFAVIGDFGDDDDDTRAVADMIKGWNPDIIVTTGDNDYSDGAYRGTFEGLELAVGQYFHEYIANYQGAEGAGASENRFFPTPGNHDWGDTCDDAGGMDDYLAYFTLPVSDSGNERYYDFRQGPVHFFSVHSLEDCEPDGATADSAQAAWVRDAALASDATFKIAFFHNPPYSSGSRHPGEGAHMRWPWSDWGFDLVLSGDDHIYERVERDGLIYVVNGVGGVELHEFADEAVSGSVVRFAGAFGAMQVDVFGDRMDVRFITVSGVVEDEFTIVAAGGAGGTDPPVDGGDWYRPEVTATWQWQLQPGAGGGINTGYDVDVYDVDLFDVSDAIIDGLHAEGRRVICYFSAGSFEDFRDDAGRFAAAELGTSLDGFADERWLDIRSANVRAIMLDRLDFAAQRGCDGVEPDNVDGYANDSGFPLTSADQLEFNRFLADAAHERGLAVGLKNDLDQIAELVAHFDFSVNEQCHEFDECDALQPFIDAGKPVFNAEYEDRFVNDAAARAEICASAAAQGIHTLVLPLDLNDSFRFSCEP